MSAAFILKHRVRRYRMTTAKERSARRYCTRRMTRKLQSTWRTFQDTLAIQTTTSLEQTRWQSAALSIVDTLNLLCFISSP